MNTPGTTADAAGNRCAHCGALNGAGARWCSLCHEPFTARTPVDPAGDTVDAPPPPPPPAVDAAPPTGPPAADLPPPPTASTSDERFRTTPAGLEYGCGLCGSWNPVAEPRCTACGAAFGALLDDGEADAVPDVPEPTLVLASLLLPGTGLYLLARRGLGAGIAVLYTMFAGGAAALLVAAGGEGRGLVAVAPLVLGALVLLLGSTLDAVNVGRGSDRLVLDSRRLLWLTVGVLGLVTALFLATALSATR